MLFEELRRRRKHARILGVALSVSLLLIAAFVFIILKSLPSTAQLRRAYFSSRLVRPVSATGTVSATTVAVSSATPAASASSAVSGSPAVAAPSPAPSGRTLADYAIDRFIDRGDRSLSVCRSLASLQSQSAPFDVETLGRAVDQEINSTAENPFADAALAPLGALLQIPNVASVATQIRDAQDSGDTSLLREAQFYSTVALAASDVYSNRSTIDRVSDHAYHLTVLSRIAATIPGAGSDPALQDLCTAAEARALTPSVATAQDDIAERSALLNVIAAMGLSPQQAGFDPNVSTQITVSVTPTQVTLASPWMSQLYGSSLTLSVRR